MRTLLTADQIQRRVAELGDELTERYRGRPLTVIAVLSGSVIFVADLIRHISTPHRLGFVRATSYVGAVTTPQAVELRLDLLPDLTGRDVLLVDDILDTGRTLEALQRALVDYRPASVTTAVLLWKTSRTIAPVRADYVGFEVPDEFVVGYGLDFNDEYRHLPHLAVLPTTGDGQDR